MELFQKPEGVNTRWFTFENRKGEKGGGARENGGRKGHPCDLIKPGGTVTLMDTAGPGVIRRIWLTVDVSQEPFMLRSLRLDIHWDGSRKPAVSAPLGDFFGVSHGLRTPFESALFSDPEGRSFNCFIPMPFRRGARVTLTNESTAKWVTLFYEIDATLGDRLGPDALYFHSHWRRENPTRLGRDFEVLPKVAGNGRFLGANIGFIENPLYHHHWFGEGEVKIHLDGDGPHPTLCGTGTEDYLGTAWGQGKFANRTQGCLVADRDRKAWSFYRWHVDDPVWFSRDIRVTLQQIGGANKFKLLQAEKRGARFKVVTVGLEPRGMAKVLEAKSRVDWKSTRVKDGAWCNYLREDDLCATAHFYLDRPDSGLSALAPLKERLEGI